MKLHTKIVVAALCTLLPLTGCRHTRQDSAAATHTVSTHATAHRRLANTAADVSVGIETEAGSVAAVTKTLATRSQQLIGYLKTQGAERLVTDSISVETKSHRVKGGPGYIVGYSGSMKVSFRSTPEKVSDLIAGTLTQGANTLDDVHFTTREEDVDKARQELATEATRTAVTQAEAVAGAAGVRVLGVQQIVVDPGNATMSSQAEAYDLRSPAAGMPRRALEAPRPIATAAGEQEVEITVEALVDVER